MSNRAIHIPPRASRKTKQMSPSLAGLIRLCINQCFIKSESQCVYSSSSIIVKTTSRIGLLASTKLQEASKQRKLPLRGFSKKTDCRSSSSIVSSSNYCCCCWIDDERANYSLCFPPHIKGEFAT